MAEHAKAERAGTQAPPTAALPQKRDQKPAKGHAALLNGRPAQRRLIETAKSLEGGRIRARGAGDESYAQLLSARPGGPQPVQRGAAANRTGLPDGLKAGVETLSGFSLDRVQVHYNSALPARIGAHAFTQGSDIHLGPGQERHLPHEAWHSVQQAQGRVRATRQMAGGTGLNDEQGLEREADVMGARAAAARPSGATPRLSAATGGGKGTIQRKGVKSELVSADANIEGLTQESTDTRVLMNRVGDAIYEAYKPAKPGQAPISAAWDTQNRDKTKGSLAENVALDRAARLAGWSKTANLSASRILAELRGIANVVDMDLSSIKMGKDTDKEPDASGSTTSGQDVAFKSKQVSSPAQSAVDKHVVAASSQLQKRYDHQNAGVMKTKFNHFVAYIEITESSNPWPYTPSVFAKKQQQGFADLASASTDRIKKYKANSTAAIKIYYQVSWPDGRGKQELAI